jgi:polyisoprenoid-binding protein YceI
MYKLVLVLLFAVFANAASLDLVEGKIQAHTEIFGDREINPQTQKIETILKKDSSIESISGKFEIDAISLVSDNEDRDQHMYEVLNVAKSPKISFVISRITKVDDKYKIDGLLTMNKINKKISSLASITQNAQDLTMNGDFSIKLTDFGLEPPSMFFITVRDQIDIKYSFDLKEEL